MGKGNETRAEIVDTALIQAVERGLENISLGPLAESLGMSKSGLFAHFRSKEALQLAVMAEAVERFKTRVVSPGLRLEAGLPRLRMLLKLHLRWIDGADGLPGCLFIATIPEYDDRPGPLRDLLVSAQIAWRRLLAACVQEAIHAGQLEGDVDPDQVAFELVGATLAYHHAKKLLGDRSALRRAEKAFGRVLAAR